jgi:hypothetical protein
MKKTLIATLVPALSVLAIVASTKEAHALGPIGVEAGAVVGYGTNPDSNLPVNPLGVGLGLRGGVVLFDSLYGGVKVTDYLGGSVGPASIHALQYGLDVGYGFSIPLLTIRPQVGIGNVGFTTSIDNLGSTSSSYLYVEPGVTALIGLGLIYVGADANYMLVPGVSQGDGTSKTEGALTIHGQVGIKL